MWNGTVQLDGAPKATFENNPVDFNRVTAGYFAALSMRLVAGRDLSERDVLTSSPVAVVHEALARRLFAGRNSVGQTFRLPEGDAFVRAVAAFEQVPRLRATHPGGFVLSSAR